MDELLTQYSQEQLLSELEHGHYWYFDNGFHSTKERMKVEKPASVEYAVYFRYYS
jgi:hypothetical protein